MARKEAEQWAIQRAMAHSGENMSEAARLLQVHRTTLWLKLRQHGMS